MEYDFIRERNIKGGKASPKITVTYSIKDYYKYYRKNGGKYNFTIFRAVLSESNKALAEELIEHADDYQLPAGMGRVAFRKRKQFAYRTKSGKLKTTAPINWKATMDLWKDNMNARRNKVLVRHTNKETGRHAFSIVILSRKFKNRQYFGLTFKRTFKRKFAERVKDYTKPKVDAYLKGKNNGFQW